MAEILPCPNPECRGRCVIRMGTWARVECTLACGYHGPYARTHRADDADAIRLHNAMPREEPWVSVAEKGLPEARRGESWDVYPICGKVFEGALRFNDCWWVDDLEEDTDLVTHYRKHSPPRGPNG